MVESLTDMGQTFRNWAGKGSDISYYLNSHHIDVNCWLVQGSCGSGCTWILIMPGTATPTGVFASKSTGVATGARFACPDGTEDSITLTVPWLNASGTSATAVYTSSWAGQLHYIVCWAMWSL